MSKNKNNEATIADDSPFASLSPKDREALSNFVKNYKTPASSDEVAISAK